MLSKIGCTFDYSDLEDWEVECYGVISGTIAKEESRLLKKSNKKG